MPIAAPRKATKSRPSRAAARSSNFYRTDVENDTCIICREGLDPVTLRPLAAPGGLRRAAPALNRGVFGVIDDRVVVEKAREGLPFAEFERLAGLLELTAQEQAALLSITERTMARRVAEHGTLHPLESERLVLLQKLAEYGVEVFEEAGKFNRWLRRPLPLLGDKSPLQYLDMSTGFVVVEQVLGRLAYGVYS